jgi:hypothetical protein
MRITITKGERDDRIEVRRPDGSTVSTRFPRKGPVPHDATHYVVESALGIADGFWGLVADGHHPEEVAELAKAAGHASAKRASAPEPSIVAILQAERAVECFEADLWNGGEEDGETLREVFAAGCAQSFVRPIPISDKAIGEIRASLAELRGRWAAMPPGDNLTFEWTLGQ